MTRSSHSEGGGAAGVLPPAAAHCPHTAANATLHYMVRYLAAWLAIPTNSLPLRTLS